jgi:hypothetical protein
MLASRVWEHVRSNLIGYICLVWLMTGTAIAATQLRPNSVGTKQLRNQAVTAAKVKKRSLTGTQVKSRSLRGAQIAPGSLNGAHIAPGSLNGTHIAPGSLTGAQINSATLGQVPKATDTDTVGTLAPSAFQRRLQGSCPAGIGSAGADGSLQCVSAANDAIVLNPPNGGDDQMQIQGPGASTGVVVAASCRELPANSFLSFVNVGSASGTLNWIYSDGTTNSGGGNKVFAGGENVGANALKSFEYTVGRIEGQFIWSLGNSVTTLNVHAFDSGGFCEVRGTATTAVGP